MVQGAGKVQKNSAKAEDQKGNRFADIAGFFYQ